MSDTKNWNILEVIEQSDGSKKYRIISSGLTMEEAQSSAVETNTVDDTIKVAGAKTAVSDDVLRNIRQNNLLVIL